MIVDGYEYNPYPFEVGDILLGKEDQDLCVLTGANYAYIHMFCITGSLANGKIYDHRILNSVDDYEKVGHCNEEGMRLLLESLSREYKHD